MGFINDDDRRAQRQYAAQEATEEAEIKKEAREKLLAAFEKVGASLVVNARKQFVHNKGVASKAWSDEVTICHPYNYAALGIYKEDPSLLIAILDHALGMRYDRDYKWGSPPKLETRHECCGWDSGLKISVCIEFTPPLT